MSGLIAMMWIESERPRSIGVSGRLSLPRARMKIGLSPRSDGENSAWAFPTTIAARAEAGAGVPGPIEPATEPATHSARAARV